jgi:hypothetical protein
MGGALSFLLIVAAVALVLFMVRWAGGHRALGGAIDGVLATHGAVRCLKAAQLLRAMARKGDQQAMLATWERLELPLLQALPDCPPDAKPGLMQALDELAKASTNRELAKRVMTLRNGLMN